MAEDTGLVGVQYNIVLSVTFIGYILMQGKYLKMIDHIICPAPEAPSPFKVPRFPYFHEISRYYLVPSNMLLSILPPSWYLGSCMAAWGCVSAATAAAHNFGGESSLAMNRGSDAETFKDLLPVDSSSV